MSESTTLARSRIMERNPLTSAAALEAAVTDLYKPEPTPGSKAMLINDDIDPYDGDDRVSQADHDAAQGVLTSIEQAKQAAHGLLVDATAKLRTDLAALLDKHLKAINADYDDELLRYELEEAIDEAREPLVRAIEYNIDSAVEDEEAEANRVIEEHEIAEEQEHVRQLHADYNEAVL